MEKKMEATIVYWGYIGNLVPGGVSGELCLQGDQKME